MAIDFNTEPFFDDYDEDKKFYRILFRPGNAVQARELTQLQTILQEQIKRHGDHIFKEGAMVIPGQVAYDLDVYYVKLVTDPNINYEAIFSAIQGQIITDSNGVLGKVVATSLEETNNGTVEPNTIFVKIIASGTDNEGNSIGVFSDDEPITLLEGSLPYDITVANKDDIQAETVGKAAVSSVQRGVYYIRGHFVLVDEQTIILDKYSNTPSYRIGLSLTEGVVYPEDDESLLDNALGSPNYSAPGAARYTIDLTLTKLALESTVDTDFIDLLRLKNGKAIFKLDRTEYAELEKTLARRTYDESGDYTLAPFPIKPREYRSNNRSSWAAGIAYIQGDIIAVSDNGINVNYFMCTSDGVSDAAVEPSWSITLPVINDGTVTWEYASYPVFNDGVYQFDSTNADYSEFTTTDHRRLASMVAYAVEPSKAYVKGYEIQKISTEYVDAFKSRYIPAGSDALCTYFGVASGALTEIDVSVSEELTATIDLSMGSYVIADTLKYAPDLINFSRVTLIDNTIANAGAAVVIGYARVRAVELHDRNETSDQYKVFLFDISMVGLNTFDQVKAIYDTATEFQCNMVQTSGLTTLVDPNNFASIYQLPDYAVKEVTNLSYDVVYPFDVTGTTQTISAPAGLSFDSVNGFGNYILIKTSGTTPGVYVDFNTGVGGEPTITINGSNQLVVANLESSATYRVMATMIGDTATFSANLSIPSDAYEYFDTEAEAAPADRTLNLQNSYIIRLVSVMMDDGTFASPTGNYSIDITNRYIVDNGQHETHIANAKLILQQNAPQPVSKIKVTYEFIEANSDAGGKIFTVNSYVAENSNIPYENIPMFKLYQLRDCLDFRPYALDSAGTLYGRFMPKFGRSAIVKYNAYLSRVDSISINTKGQYQVTYGIPNLTAPRESNIPTDAMKLAVVNVEPYTFSTAKGLEITRVDNKRYTMRDIGKLENRIKDLEYYTSLSLLEADTTNMSVIDSTGLDRFKNGFLVDSFNGQGVGNTASAEWNASIDSKNQELRPFFSQRQISLLENVQKENIQYDILGDIISMPISSEVAMISQVKASKDVSVNPYDLYTFKGLMYLNPWSDTWFSTERRPDIIINNDGQYNAVVSKAEADGVLGTIWNAWQVVSQGEPTTIASRLDTISSNALGNRFAKIDTELINSSTQPQGSSSPYWRNRATFTTEELNAIGIFDGRLSGSFANSVAGSRVLTIETDAVEVVSARAGKRTFIEDKVDSRVVDDKVVETQTVPYIRPRAVLFNTTGLKPYTDVNAFFDGINVNKYIEKAQIIRVTPIDGYGNTFDTERNCGSDVSRIERLVEMPGYGQGTITVVNGSPTIEGFTTGFESEFVVGDFIIIDGVEYKIQTITDNNTLTLDTNYTGTSAAGIAYKVRIPGLKNSEVEVAFNHGEVIRDSVTGTTGIVVGQEAHRVNSTTTYYYLHVLNVKKGTSSSAWSTSGYLEGQYSDTNGNSGKKPRVKFVAAQALSSKSIKTSATGQLHGLFRIPNNPIDRFRTGVRELVFSDQTDAKSNAETSARAIYEANGVVEIKQRTVISTRTAQLKIEDLNENDGGVIVTNDRLVRDTGWFDPLAQTFMVQEEGGAFLTSVDLFFSAADNNIPVRVEVREVVNGYPGQAVLPFSRVEKRPGDVYTSSDGSISTRFSFQSPVYVQEGTEYALIILSDSAAYRVHIAETGAIDYAGKKISSQPYNGVFFKSQNASTWTASQLEDLKFVMNKAQFSTGSYEVELIPPKLNLKNLDYNPFYFVEGSSKVRVSHRNNGFIPGETVSLSTRQYVETLDVWNYAEVFKTHTVISSEEDAYVIDLDPSGTIEKTASATGRLGGAYIYATENYEFSTAMLNATNTAVTGTTISFKLKTIDHNGVVYTTDIVNGENYNFSAPRVLNYSETDTSDVVVTATLASTNANVSPVLDTGRIALTLVNNKVDSPRAAVVNDPDLDEFVLANTINFTSVTDVARLSENSILILSSQTALFNTFSELSVGNAVRFRYSGTGGTYIVFVAQTYVNEAGHLVIEFDSEDFSTVSLPEAVSPNTVDIHWLSHYNSEIGVENGSVTSKYVTKKINLSRPSEMLRIMLAAQIPDEADVEVYYKTGQSVDSDFIASRYYRAAPTSGYVKSPSQYTDIEFDVEGLEPFNSVIVKIVMRSTNIAKVPRIKDFRVIACA